MSRRNALYVAARALGKLAPVSTRSQTLAPVSIPPGLPTNSIPPGKLASPATRMLWRPKQVIYLGQAGNIHRLVLPTCNDDESGGEEAGDQESPYKEIGSEGIFTQEQENCLVPDQGLVLSTISNGSIEKRAHLTYRGMQGVRSALQLFPIMPKPGQEKGHWPRLQVAVYPYEDRCWMSVLDGDGSRYWCDTTITFAIEFVTSCNMRQMQKYDDPTRGHFYEGPIKEELRDEMILRLENVGFFIPQKDDLIGKGTQGKVYLSKSTKVTGAEGKTAGLLGGRVAALKKLAVTFGGEPLESQITKQVNISLLRPMLASWRESQNTVYIAFEFCKRSLQEYGQCGFEFVLLERLQMFLDIVIDVDKLHDLGICHRDININNILVTADGVAKLADFGHAAVLDGTLFPALDGKGISCEFSAPELKLGIPHSSKVDEYSLSFIYYYLMSSSQNPEQALNKFVDVVCSAAWSNREKAWRENKFSDEWHGDKALLFRMMDTNANSRASTKEIIPEVRKALQLLRRCGQ